MVPLAHWHCEVTHRKLPHRKIDEGGHDWAKSWAKVGNYTLHWAEQAPLLGTDWASRGQLLPVKQCSQTLGNSGTALEGIGLQAIVFPFEDGLGVDVTISAHMVARTVSELVGLERIDPSGKCGMRAGCTTAPYQEAIHGNPVRGRLSFLPLISLIIFVFICAICGRFLFAKIHTNSEKILKNLEIFLPPPHFYHHHSHSTLIYSY